MKCLMVHNSYQQPGGEDQVFEAEAGLLESFGHTVVRFTAHNDQIRTLGQLELARATIWNGDTYRDVRAILRRERPEVLHAHNIFPLISPSIYYAARAEHVPVVQTLHNYRLVCPNALLFRDGRPCQACVGHSPLLGAVHACYRGSRLASAAVGAMLMTHRLVGTWRRRVDQYIALTEFARRLFVHAGLPPDRVTVKPNFIEGDPGLGHHSGEYALF